jgi:pimeloyl-ACP methyl ester carboxylesterase
MYVEIDGNRIRYDEYGKDKSIHILFIHGLGSSSIVWRDIPEALSEHFHTIAIDLIGFGGSDKPDVNYTINYFTQFIKNFLRQIGIKSQEKISIVGHSLGGYITAEYAIENKEQIEKIVLIDSSGMLYGPTTLLEQYLDAAMENDTNLRYKKINRVYEDLLADRSRLLQSVPDTFIGFIGRNGAKHAFESAFHNSTKIHIETEKLKQIQNIPCLIIWGEKDILIPSNHINKFKKVLKDSKSIIISDAGHSPFVEKPATVYEKIRTFFID